MLSLLPADCYHLHKKLMATLDKKVDRQDLVHYLVIGDSHMQIIVIGGGVSGLTTGLSLLREGHRISIWAESLPPHTTSNVAAAHWFPFLAEPIEKVNYWAIRTYETFKEIISSSEIGETGVFMEQTLHLEAKLHDNPGWAAGVNDFRRANAAEIPQHYNGGYVFNAPVMDMSIYLSYLQRQFLLAGGHLKQGRVDTLSEAFEQTNIVVNCCGLGARHLANDPSIYGTRGQVVRVRHNGFNRIISAEDGPHGLTYVVPRINDIVLGGTAAEFDENVAINSADTASILQRCKDLVPELSGIQESDIISVACGLRPVRPCVRVEMEHIAPDKFILHNYGHGGAGVTLSWGCAEEIVNLLRMLPS